MRAFITGIGGFVGRHLAAFLFETGDSVCGLARPEDAQGLSPDLELFVADLLDREQVDAAIRSAAPDAIYHLAAQSSTTDSLGDPWGTLGNNLHAQMNLLEACVQTGVRPRVLVIGSAEEYGNPRPQDLPTHEDAPLCPLTPYAVSKVGQDVMGYQYFAQYGLPVVRVRPFGHTGPGHDPRFVIPSFARQLAEMEAGLREPVLRVGNLEVERDFTDARDVVRAYRSVLLGGEPGEVYNVGRGASFRLRDTLDQMIGLCRVPVRVEVDPNRLRPSDVPRQLADTRRLRAATDWSPQIPWETTLKDTLDYWRARIAAPTATS